MRCVTGEDESGAVFAAFDFLGGLKALPIPAITSTAATTAAVITTFLRRYHGRCGVGGGMLGNRPVVFASD
ncbi:MAG: hypothetical protein ACRDPA_16015 [Solirubrobacteraceae bacterium]